MTKIEALEIINFYEFYQDKACTCFQGHTPCGKCENYPTNDLYEEALKIYNGENL